MLRLILLSCLVFSTTAVGSDSARAVHYQAYSLTPSNTMPTFDNGYLVAYDRTVSVYAPDGSLAYTISTPEKGVIFNVAVDTDGTSAAAIEDYRIGRIGRILIFNGTGSPIGGIDTGRYLPSFVCFAPDHSIWSMGWQPRQSLTDKPDYFVLRHFSLDGKELGAFLPRSSFPEYDRVDAPWPCIGASGLRIANNRIGVYLHYGGDPANGLWVEADLNGKEIGRWPATSRGNPAAFTPSGAVYARDGNGISVLDRVTGKWNRVAIQSDGALVGSDGEALVFLIKGTADLRWLSVNR